MSEALHKLEEIGGFVSEAEVCHHLGADAVVELFEAETQGLVESRVEFTLTEAGRALVVEGARA
jgi:hypothetical protein